MKHLYNKMVLTPTQQEAFWRMRGMFTTAKLTETGMFSTLISHATCHLTFFYTGWMNIEHSICSFLDEYHPLEDRFTVLQDRFRTLDSALAKILPGVWIKPNLVDTAWRCEEVQAIMRLPVSLPVTMQHFMNVQVSISDFVHAWRASVFDHFRGMVRQRYPIPDDTDPLSLAIGYLFSCVHCGYTSGFPSILSHTCHRRYFKPESPNFKHSGLFMRAGHALLANSRLPVLDMTSDKFGSRAGILASVVQSHGLDPARATWTDMSRAESRIFCCDCLNSKEEPTIATLDWCSAVCPCSVT